MIARCVEMLVVSCILKRIQLNNICDSSGVTNETRDAQTVDRRRPHHIYTKSEPQTYFTGLESEIRIRVFLDSLRQMIPQ